MADSSTRGGPHAGSKRHATDPDVPVFERLELTPLGGGNEVGRSCLVLRYKGKTIMMDCGILPSFSGLESLPWLGELDPAEVDIVFITHFHLDHAAALPHFTERLAGFRGRIFATHATIACMKLMLSDFVRVTTIAGPEDPNALYGEKDIDRCIARMEAVDFKQKMVVDGLQFMFYNAGHVLGAAMVLMEIAGVRILYTGDYSCEEDRHLMAAEIPRAFPPDVLIVEATYGMQVHESREERERRFTDTVERVVRRGGRCLIPVFALGRAQELLLILDEFWAARPELQGIPIYFSSKLASRSLEVYRTYISSMNARIQSQMGDRNPWDFRFVKSLARPDDFRDEGPCVVLASPGMLQSGFSRMLFDRWAEDPRNGVILAGYSVEGTLARRLESNPAEVESMASRKLVRRIGVERVSFSAHADSLQTSAFVDALQPPCVILVHGEKSEMRKLRDGLAKRLEGKNSQVFMPPNGSTVTLNYQETRMIKALGSIAARKLVAGHKISGVLVHRNFEYFLLQPSDLPKYTALTTHTLAQRQHVPFRSSFALLKSFVLSMFPGSTEGLQDEEGREIPQFPNSSSSSSSSGSSSTEPPATSTELVVSLGGKPPKRFLRISGGSVTVLHAPPDRVILSWMASPTADMVADALVALIAQTEVSQAALRASSRPCGGHSHGGGGGHSHAEGEECEHGHEEGGRAHASSPSTPFEWSDVAASTAADGETPGGPATSADGTYGQQDGGEEGANAHVHALADLLLATLCEQYGPANVRYEGAHGELVCSAFPGVSSGPPSTAEPGTTGEVEAQARFLSDDDARLALTVDLDGTVGFIAHSTGEGWSSGLRPAATDSAQSAAALVIQLQREKFESALRHTLTFARAAFSPGNAS